MKMKSQHIKKQYLTGIFKALNANIWKKGRSQINNASFQL